MRRDLFFSFSLFIYLSFFLSSFLSSCKKESNLYAFKGDVINNNNQPVLNASIKIFKTPEDWLTGHNMVINLQSDLAGHFESAKIYEEGSYYIFIEKYDTSNWELSQVQKGNYPTIYLPINENLERKIEHNNIGMLANTKWKLTNVLKEYTKNGQSAVEWHSQWSATNNCFKDNKIYFGKDLTMTVSEGKTICNNTIPNIFGTFVPPMIFTSWSCQKLPNSSQNVKEFEFSGWPEMESKNAKMFVSCNESMGLIYVYYQGSGNKMMLNVYSKF
jgi:hypothetical protein